MTVCGTLLGAREAEIRVAAATRLLFRSWGRSADVVRCHTWDELFEFARWNPDTVLVLDPYFMGAFAESPIRDILSSGRRSEAIVYADFSGRPGMHIAKLVELGIQRFWTLGVDDTIDAMTKDLLDAVGGQDIRSLLDDLDGVVDAKHKVIFRWAIRRGGGPLSVADVSNGLNISGRTIRRWFAGLDGMSAGTVVRWARVLHACRVLAYTGAPAGTITARLRFSSYSDFCRKFSGLTGIAIRDVRREEAFEVAKAEFQASVSRAVRSGE